MLGNKKTNRGRPLGSIFCGWKTLLSTRKFTSFFVATCFALILSIIPVLSSSSNVLAVSTEQCTQLGGTIHPGTGNVCSFTKAQLSKADCTKNDGTIQEKTNPSGGKEYNGCQIALSGSTAGSSIQTSAACTAAGGVWQADGNYEGPGEMGTCVLTGGGTTDPSIQTKAACDAAGGVWKADGNYEGPGEMGTCTILKDSIDGLEQGEDEDEEESVSCQIEGVGWLLCPVLNFIGNITDQAYSAVETLLITPSSMFLKSDTSGGYKALNSAWGAVRNIANVAFVVAFLVIIYSQITSRGISNYGIKKMLPRLIVSAILVNASFIVCALAVDISNVVGTGVHGFFHGLTENITASVDSVKWSSSGQGGFWGPVVGLVLAGAIGGGAIWALGVSVLLPILIAALVAILTVVVVLTLRQALILLLVIIAPLAFVAFLLPNTENLFRKWMKFFIVLLAMFPSIALIFSVSQIAGLITMAASTSWMVQLMGAGMTIIPLFITPVVMKTAGSTLGRITGMIGMDKARGIGGWAKGIRASDKKRLSNSRLGRAQKGGLRGMTNKAASFRRRVGIAANAANQRAEMTSRAVEGELTLQSHEKFLEKQGDKQNSTNAENRVKSAIRGQLQSDENTDVQNAKAELQTQSGSELKQTLENSINDGDNIKIMASLELLGGKGNFGMRMADEALRNSEGAINSQFLNGNKGIRNDIAGTLQQTGMVGKSETLKNWSGAVASTGELENDKNGNKMSFAQARQNAKDGAGGMSAAKFAAQAPHEQEELLKGGNVSSELAGAVLSTPESAKLDGAVRDKLTKIANGAGSNSNTLKIDHGSNNGSSGTPSSPSSPAPSAPSGTQQPPGGGATTPSGTQAPASAPPSTRQQYAQATGQSYNQTMNMTDSQMKNALQQMTAAAAATGAAAGTAAASQQPAAPQRPVHETAHEIAEKKRSQRNNRPPES